MNDIRFVVLDPGHFHAALVQKYRSPGTSDTVNVYAPGGKDLDDYLALVHKYNTRADDPTSWKEHVYTGPDYLEKMVSEKAGNVVILAGNNKRKAQYIQRSLETGFHVLADKPMVINYDGFLQLENDFRLAEQKGLLLFDIMTERYSVINTLQRVLMKNKEVFGEVQKGSHAAPGVTIKSVHHFYKEVSGSPLIRPAWFFDVTQQGEGIADICTHLVDTIQWLCCPECELDYASDVVVDLARRWATDIAPDAFKKVTGLDRYPEFLSAAVHDDVLQVFSNGSIHYRLKGIHAEVEEQWDFEAVAGAGDTYHSIVRGSKATLIVEQGSAQRYTPELYIEAAEHTDDSNWRAALKQAIGGLAPEYDGLSIQQEGSRWHVIVPAQYRIGHERQFSMVAAQFFQYLQQGKLPGWEKCFMLAKYFTTTAALRKA